METDLLLERGSASWDATEHATLPDQKSVSPWILLEKIVRQRVCLLQPSLSDPVEESEGGKEVAEVYFPLTYPETPSYSYDYSSPVVEHATPSSSPGSGSAGRSSALDAYNKKQESFCCIGLRAPVAMGHAWTLGIPPGDIGNVPRYLFLAVQSVLLLAAIYVSFAAPFDSVAPKCLRIGALSIAFSVNILERSLFWFCRAHSNFKDRVLWNLRADFIRLLATELFIYIGLVIALYTTSRHYLNGFPEGDYLRNGYTVVTLIGFLYFLTAVVMKTFVLVKLARFVVKARDSNAVAFQRRLFVGICCVWTYVQVAFFVLIAVILQSPTFSFLFVPVVMFTIIAMGMWFLYILDVLPWAWFFPTSILDSSPPHKSLHDISAFSSLYQEMHDLVITYGGFRMNILRLTRPKFVLPMFGLLITFSVLVTVYVLVFLLK